LSVAVAVEAVGNYCDAVLSGESIAGRSLLAQFGLTPKTKRGLTASVRVRRVTRWMRCDVEELRNWSR